MTLKCKEEIDYILSILPLESDAEGVKESKRKDALTLNALLTRLPVLLLAKIKAGNNSCKPKNEIRKIMHILYKHNKITKKTYNILIKSLEQWENNILETTNL